MQFKALVIAAVATLAAAQTSTTASHTTTAGGSSSTGSACSGQNILDACKASIQGQINSCGMQDWSCLCTQWNNYLTCYGSSGCTSDPTIGTSQQQRDLYCNNAAVYGSTTVLGTASSTSGMATHTSMGTASQSGSGTTTSSASDSTNTGAAAAINARGLVALAAAGAVVML